ncbi:hypothetical protein BT96DRAFT_1074995 [Gymnopus androsaceus JB14]|uniref:Uncharacterized protein n=1 Tax=Gymnopus androsaceus JB14 TaxID=1447944 RepID=A0A6A4GSM3_9AGAR|nr:hypothetical protein BT96DRAFT_1074995 [Gymnopus androsaceus JB14]
MYTSHSNSDQHRYVEEVDLDELIYFWMENPSKCRILLSDAFHSHARQLLNREKMVSEGRGPSVSIRLKWPSYCWWSHPGPITWVKLAKNNAKCIQRFITEHQNHSLKDKSNTCWKVSQSGAGDNSIKLEDLILVSMHHVSMGSWQPQLRLTCPLYSLPISKDYLFFPFLAD